MSVLHLKELVHLELIRKYGGVKSDFVLAPTEQKLVFGAKVLDNTTTLSSHNIQKQSSVQLLIAGKQVRASARCHSPPRTECARRLVLDTRRMRFACRVLALCRMLHPKPFARPSAVSSA